MVMIVGTVVFWLWIFSGAPKRANPDRLDDRAFVTRTHERCRDLLSELDRLPDARATSTPTARAEVLDRANGLVSTMVDELEADAPTTGEDGQRLRGWFSDWRTYVGDREDYAEALREDPGARMTVSENVALSDGVDKTIEVFADVNDMPDCATPGDVG
ncbi:hypothetical protein KSP35_20145 [Aquihabitans sp. G128]|uniref:hypothetical protein n=1 Tax=Aquihabitans sp. G128 TaxID=2849779 RepID=UPI001C23AB45|nr:hypothetical protein [Aquihabitans sp. G128]QXC60607.1 hypothetical protein KSP35_20145 [Aquihabitans sp. G128]